jgi:hypothetical protein
MLQIDHVYEFLYQELFKDFLVWHLPNGVPKIGPVNFNDVTVFTLTSDTESKIFFYDQEPFLLNLVDKYIKMFKWPSGLDLEEVYQKLLRGDNPYMHNNGKSIDYKDHLKNLANPNRAYKEPHLIVISEHSSELTDYATKNNLKLLYYFFHGFAALDWYRGYYALNYNKSIVKQYNYDFITFNRIINNDRSYRIYFVSLLKAQGLLSHGQVSFNVTDNLFDDWQDEISDASSKLSANAKQHIEQHMTDISKLVIDSPNISGSASANIPRTINSWMATSINTHKNVDAFWHVVTETVFYYDKLHLTEKIFKPIVSKQPFMLLAAPGNLAYLKSYGFKTFDSVIDESYDTIQDNDLRIEAVVKQLHWYCNLTPGEKTDIIQQLEPIIDYNFHHFYGEFRHIITRELLDNTKTLFKEIGYDDSHINYTNIHRVLTH